MVVVNFPHIFLEVLGIRNISQGFWEMWTGTSGKKKAHTFFLDVCMNSCYKLWDDIHYQAKMLYHNSRMWWKSGLWYYILRTWVQLLSRVRYNMWIWNYMKMGTCEGFPWTFSFWLPSLKLTARTWKSMVGRLVSCWDGLVLGALAVSFREGNVVP